MDTHTQKLKSLISGALTVAIVALSLTFSQNSNAFSPMSIHWGPGKCGNKSDPANCVNKYIEAGMTLDVFVSSTIAHGGFISTSYTVAYFSTIYLLMTKGYLSKEVLDDVVANYDQRKILNPEFADIYLELQHLRPEVSEEDFVQILSNASADLESEG